MGKTAKLFWSGRSQAVRLPKGAHSRRTRFGLPSMPSSSDALSPLCAICLTQTLALRY